MKEKMEALEAVEVLRGARKQWELDKHLRSKNRAMRERNRYMCVEAPWRESVWYCMLIGADTQAHTHTHAHTQTHTHTHTHTIYTQARHAIP